MDKIRRNEAPTYDHTSTDAIREITADIRQRTPTQGMRKEKFMFLFRWSSIIGQPP